MARRTLAITFHKDLAARRSRSDDVCSIGAESDRDPGTVSSERRCIALRHSLGTGLVDDDTALQGCSYTRKLCAHESNVPFS
jgi:hypothetical protein